MKASAIKRNGDKGNTNMAALNLTNKYIKAAQGLEPQIRAYQDEMENKRRMPLPLVQAMKDAGMFSLSMPKEWGGPEIDPISQIKIVELLSAIDGSVGWATMLGLHAGYFIPYLDQSVARNMYTDLSAFTGGVTKPTGEAVIVNGGYRVSGRWTFGSCCQNSTWLFSGCLVVEDGEPRIGVDGNPEIILCYLPGNAVEVIETWISTGLRGTGSHDYAITDHYVPAERAFNPIHTLSRRSEPLYSMRNMHLANLSGIPLGIARSSIDAVIELTEHKSTRTGSQLREEAHVHTAVAQAEALLGSARGFVFDTMEDIWNALLHSKSISNRQYALYRLSICKAYDNSVEAVDLMYKTGSGSSLYTSHPLDRYFRDIHAAAQHFVVSTKIIEAAGRVLIGLKPGVTTF